MQLLHFVFIHYRSWLAINIDDDDDDNNEC